VFSNPAAAGETKISDTSSSTSEPFSTPAVSTSSVIEPAKPADLVVAGALAVDFSCDYAPFSTNTNQVDPLPHTSNPATITQSLGGVAHNIAKAAHLLGASVHLHSAVGQDLSGRAAVSQLEEEGMSVDGIAVLAKPARTAQYVAVNNVNKDLALAMADMSILETMPQHTISVLATSLFEEPSTRPNIFVADANWSWTALHTWLQAARHSSTTTIFEPVSTAKAIRIFPPKSSSSTTNTFNVYPEPLADIITPNTYELTALHNFAAQESHFEHPAWFSVIDALGIPMSGLRVPLAINTTSEIVDQGIPQQAVKLLPFFPTILTKLGPQGLLMVKLLPAGAPELHDDAERQYVLARNMGGHETIGGLYVRLFPPERVLAPEEVVSVNGIGDTFCGALAVGLVNGSRVQNVIDFAQRAAGLSLRSRESVSPELKGMRGEVAELK
jgi:pseudouridine-5'-phosphate glycosidase/pseudouridine kinase